MKRKPIVAITLLLIIAFTVVPAAAQEGGFTDSFDDPQLPEWEHSPEAVVAEGALQIGPGNFAARGGGWQDFELSFKLKFSGPGESHINYRASDSGSYLLILLEDAVVLLKNQGEGQESELAVSPGWQPSQNAWMEFKITLQGGQHSISIDGSEIISASDSEPLAPGGVVFASHGERTTTIDDVSLQVLVPEAGGEPQPGAAVEPVAVESVPTALPTQAPNALQSILDSLSTSAGSTVDVTTFGVNLVLAALYAFVLSRVYVYWGSSLSNRRKFAANFMLVTVTTTFIILVVRSSVALSLGLVGALSIIRFRTAVKEPEELAYLFFAISLGIGLGDNQRLVTTLSLVVGILLLGLGRLLRQTQSDVNLHLSITNRGSEKTGMQQIQQTLEKYCSKLRLIRYDENSELMELAFVVEFRHLSDLEQARDALLALSPQMEVSFLDNKGIW
ncbi:MAG: DUF4956 domain-containing protein [Anaerolineales bacterium]